jgi:hypothetical protein
VVDCDARCPDEVSPALGLDFTPLSDATTLAEFERLAHEHAVRVAGSFVKPGARTLAANAQPAVKAA